MPFIDLNSTNSNLSSSSSTGTANSNLTTDPNTSGANSSSSLNPSANSNNSFVSNSIVASATNQKPTVFATVPPISVLPQSNVLENKNPNNSSITNNGIREIRGAAWEDANTSFKIVQDKVNQNLANSLFDQPNNLNVPQVVQNVPQLQQNISQQTRSVPPQYGNVPQQLSSVSQTTANVSQQIGNVSQLDQSSSATYANAPELETALENQQQDKLLDIQQPAFTANNITQDQANLPAANISDNAVVNNQAAHKPDQDLDLAELKLGTEITNNLQELEDRMHPDPRLELVPAIERKEVTQNNDAFVNATPILPETNTFNLPATDLDNTFEAKVSSLEPAVTSKDPVGIFADQVASTLPPISSLSTETNSSAQVLPEVTQQPALAQQLLALTKVTAANNFPNKNIESLQLQSKIYGLTDLLKQAVEKGASDLHLTADYRAMVRIDGKLEELQSQVLTHANIMSMLEDVVAEHDHVDLRHDLDIDVSYSINNPNARFRVNIFYQRNTIGAVFRLIPAHIRTIEELKLPPIIKEFTSLPAGLVLVTGPTGSGKTTTLAALVNSINTNEQKHIITIEDPIEYVYPKGLGLVDQRAVFIDTPDWHTALRAVLRQDPNVVLIGEMRDVETMEAALTIAETGHLVFSTLHTNGASQTIDRIIDAFPEEKQGQVRTQLASVLSAVVSQRLIPISGGGRRVAAEVMLVTPAIRNSIREQKVYQIDNIIQTSADLGMLTMEKSLVNLVREGIISPETAQNYANRPEEILAYLNRN